jgi:hypothetical protein
MGTATNTQVIQVAGISIQSTQLRNGTGQIGQEVSLPKGSAGSLTTRTNNTDGVVTLGAGHGLQTGDKVDLYWSGGQRYGVSITVNVNAITITGGAGDNLPVQDTAVVMTKQVVIDTDFDGDLVQMIAAVNTQKGNLDFQTNADVSILARGLVANEAWQWAADTGAANPLTGDPVGKVRASNGSATVDSVLKIGVVYAST